MSDVRVRIPPSPTGNLHVGTARTALFNELFARRRGGKVILRFEDTDRARSKPEFENNILKGLGWLGVNWDEGPYRQSERSDIYGAAIKKLLEEDKAYKEGEAVKLRVEPQEVVFQDEARGEVKTHSRTWGGDFVIARSETDALYHLAVVVDDAEMGITHIIRGEDHISNTPRQILLQQALGYPRLTYVHLPLLLDQSRRKLSKRAGDTDLLAYRDMGYLPEAMVNYLAQLGWSPKDDREFLTREELIEAFTLDGIQKAGAIFSLAKLQAMNKHYIRKLSGEELLKQAEPFLTPDVYMMYTSGVYNGSKLIAALKTEQERVATLKELGESIGFFMPDWKAEYSPELLIWRKSDRETTKELLKKLQQKLETGKDFSEEALEKDLLAWIDENKLGRGDTLWPMRIALTGKEHSPGPFEVAAVLGEDETIKRLLIASEKL